MEEPTIKRKTKVINFYGGPGSGKSTMGARLFSELKELGINCEYIDEFAKYVTWEKSLKILQNQIYVFAKQHHKMWICSDQVDYIVTDSPLPLCLFYAEDNTSSSFQNLIVEEYYKYNNIDIFLKRVKPYNPSGRNQNEETAKKIDVSIFNLMHKVKPLGGQVFDLVIDGDTKSIPDILEYIKNNNL